MRTVICDPPVNEPVSLSEFLLHLRHESADIASALSAHQSILPGSHAIANDYTTHVGLAVDVLGKTAFVHLNAGSVGEGGKVDVIVQESDDAIAWNDWGSFSQITAANDNAVYEQEYTGSKHYIRAAAKVTAAPCEFGVNVVAVAMTSAEDALLHACLTAAREHVEDDTNRQIMHARWIGYLDGFPDEPHIVLPYGNLEGVFSFTYRTRDGGEVHLTEDVDYIVETNGLHYGRLVLPYGMSWPAVELYPSNPIVISFDCGWATAAEVPERIKAAIKMIAADLYENREGRIVGLSSYRENPMVRHLLSSYRLRWEFWK